VALGREYENILTKLMTNMNSRLALSHKNAGNLLDITAKFSGRLAAFRETYQSYDKKIETLLSINCERVPADFYDALNEARAKRSEVQAIYQDLNHIIETYQAELTVVWSAQ
jgi:hypothetical protein